LLSSLHLQLTPRVASSHRIILRNFLLFSSVEGDRSTVLDESARRRGFVNRSLASPPFLDYSTPPSVNLAKRTLSTEAMAEKSSTPDLNEGPYTFPFNLVKDMEVKGEDEKPYKLGDILGKSKNILLFTRHFG